MNRVLVTGATGFVGSALCEQLASCGYQVRAAVRSARQLPDAIAEQVVVGDIGPATEWEPALRDVDYVVHAAARAHVMGDNIHNSDLYFATNAHGTRRLAQAASQSGVRRFLYLSTIKVNGEERNRPYSPADVPHPEGMYAVSKLSGEEAVMQTAASGSMQAAIIRPPMVYGPGVRANFLRLLRWVDGQWPLPLGAINNRRSLVSVWNLCSLLTQMLSNDAAGAGTWLVSDMEDLSTPGLIRRLAGLMRRRPRLIPIPEPMLKMAGRLTGRSAEVARLCGSLTVDATDTKQKLGWSPPLTVAEGLARTVEWYLSRGRAR